MIRNFFKFIGLNCKIKCDVNSFIIGNICYVIFDYGLEKGVIFDKVLEQILINELKFYWFRSYFEFENNIDHLIDINDKYIFVIIG